LVLDMLVWGKKDIRSMTWLNPPPISALVSAEKVLEAIEGLDQGNLTSHGKELHQVPAHPRIAHMLLYAKKANLLPLATDIAAILEEKDPLASQSGVDLNLRIEGLRRFRGQVNGAFAYKKIDKVAGQYRKLFSVVPENSPVNPWATGLLLAYAYPERIAAARPGNNAQFQLANGKIAQLGHKDDLAHESWLAVAHLDARDGMGKIWMAAPLNPKDLAPMLKTKEVLEWDRKKGGLQAHAEIRIGAIVLGNRPLPKVNPELAVQLLLETLKEEGRFLLDWSDAVLGLIARVQSLAIWHPEQDWPNWSVDSLCTNAANWLEPYLMGITKNEELKKLNLSQFLYHSLSYEQQQDLEKMAPSSLQVPSGSEIQITYQEDGSAPRLAVRLQELFGMLETPKVNEGRNPILIELLSPGYKPVQLTQDLKSFWTSGYFEVKKELKQRYPKHSWPDDPIQAVAIRGVKKRE
jgi:ATP-dependent helicase HrpB